MRRVGLFGGSFNPPHIGHLIIAETIRDEMALDAVYWIPARRPPHKEEERLASASARFRMTELAIDGHPDFCLSSVEWHRDGPSYTIDTINQLYLSEPNVSFSLILGSDSLVEFNTWYRPEEILEKVNLLVYPRSGDAASASDDRIKFVEAPLLQISSTEIRSRVRKGLSIRYRVPEPVREYVLEHGLYRREPA